jgi:hypothetical protein
MSAVRRWVLAAAGFLLLAVIHTWPLALDPAHLSRNDNADAQLNAWIVCWIDHQLPRDPLHLFDANAFYPERRALAFSEPLLVPALVGAPLRLMGASPVLTFNVVLILGFVGTGLAGFALGRSLGGNSWAGALCGSLLAFNAHSLSRLPHLQAHYACWLPLALLALDRLVLRRRIADAAALGLAVALLVWTSGYWAVLTIVALAVALVARVNEWWRWSAASALAPRLLLAAGLSVALTAPAIVAYWRVHREQGLTRSPAESAAYAATPLSYASTPARLHLALWADKTYDSTNARYFPGLAALLLCGIALATRETWRDARMRGLVAMAFLGGLLSLGPATPLYGWLNALLPPMRGLRDPSRFGFLVLLAVAALAACGLRRLGPRGGWVLALCLLCAVHLEALCAPISYARFDGFSPIYAAVARLDRQAVLAEVPFYGPPLEYRNAAYMLASTVHWKPIVNGYSGFAPAAYVRRAGRLEHFPDAEAIAELQRSGVTHVIVHLRQYRAERAERIVGLLAARGDFEYLESGPDGERLYRLVSGEPR